LAGEDDCDKVICIWNGEGFAPPKDDCDKAYWDWKDSAALQRCEIAANSGSAEAQWGYGLILWSGPPQGVNHTAALDWLRKSARQGYWFAQVFLGGVLQHRELSANLRNRPEAFAWLIAAGATQGAARLRAHLSEAEIREADRLASEFVAKYPAKRPAQSGSP
jgi:TPR repeat protein